MFGCRNSRNSKYFRKESFVCRGNLRDINRPSEDYKFSTTEIQNGCCTAEICNLISNISNELTLCQRVKSLTWNVKLQILNFGTTPTFQCFDLYFNTSQSNTYCFYCVYFLAINQIMHARVCNNCYIARSVDPGVIYSLNNSNEVL